MFVNNTVTQINNKQTNNEMSEMVWASGLLNFCILEIKLIIKSIKTFGIYKHLKINR